MVLRRLSRAGALIALLFAVWLVVPAGPRAQDASGVVRVGVMTGPAPHYRFSFESGEATGFAIDVWQEVAKRAGIRYRIVYLSDVDAVKKAAAAGLIDVVPLLPVDDSTRALFDFTSPVHQSPIRVFTRKNNSQITDRLNLAGRRVSVVEGHPAQTLVRRFRGALKITHETVDEALNALLSQTTGAIIHQEEVLVQHARQQGVASLLKIVGEPLTKLDLGIGIRKGQRQLTAQLDFALKTYQATDVFYEAREPWGGNPPPWIDPIEVAKVLVSVLGALLVAIGIWRYISVVRLNEALSRSATERQAAQDRFQDLAESASDWFFEQDENLKLTFLSPRFETVTGIPPGELLGKRRWEYHGTEGDDEADVEKWRDHAATVEARKDWKDFVYSLTRKDGGKRIIMTSGKAVFDDTGTFAGYRGVGRDITRRIELEQSLQQALKMELVGQLTGGIAHDFNNLLTVMTGNLELMRGRLDGDKDLTRYLSTASEAADLGSKLTQQLLAFSRRQTLRPEGLDLNELLTGMMGLIESSSGRGIRVELNLDPVSPHVFADGPQLQNAILNLVVNARDAMPSGGDLVISTSEMQVDAAFVDAHPGARGGRFVVLKIKDEGTGIAKDKLEKVIEPFFTTKSVGKGSGLGLSMVYGFARQSNGFLLIDSIENQGTTIRIFLPVLEGDEAAAAAKTEPDLHCRNGKAAGETVLVVEDDPHVREIATVRLEEIGYRVLEAENARDALDTLRSTPGIEVLFTDVVMPGGMSGIDLAGEVRRKWPDVRVLFTTGYSENVPTYGQGGEPGPCLTKPYKHDELAEKMREVLEVRPVG